MDNNTVYRYPFTIPAKTLLVATDASLAQLCQGYLAIDVEEELAVSDKSVVVRGVRKHKSGSRVGAGQEGVYAWKFGTLEEAKEDVLAHISCDQLELNTFLLEIPCGMARPLTFNPILPSPLSLETLTRQQIEAFLPVPAYLTRKRTDDLTAEGAGRVEGRDEEGYEKGWIDSWKGWWVEFGERFEGMYGYPMELAMPLDLVVKHIPPMAPQENVLFLVDRLVQCVKAFSEVGVTHNDLKLANVFLSLNPGWSKDRVIESLRNGVKIEQMGTVKLGDYGSIGRTLYGPIHLKGTSYGAGTLGFVSFRSFTSLLRIIMEQVIESSTAEEVEFRMQRSRPAGGMQLINSAQIKPSTQKRARETDDFLAEFPKAVAFRIEILKIASTKLSVRDDLVSVGLMLMQIIHEVSSTAGLELRKADFYLDAEAQNRVYDQLCSGWQFSNAGALETWASVAHERWDETKQQFENFHNHQRIASLFKTIHWGSQFSEIAQCLLQEDILSTDAADNIVAALAKAKMAMTTAVRGQSGCAVNASSHEEDGGFGQVNGQPPITPGPVTGALNPFDPGYGTSHSMSSFGGSQVLQQGSTSTHLSPSGMVGLSFGTQAPSPSKKPRLSNNTANGQDMKKATYVFPYPTDGFPIWPRDAFFGVHWFNSIKLADLGVTPSGAVLRWQPFVPSWNPATGQFDIIYPGSSSKKIKKIELCLVGASCEKTRIPDRHRLLETHFKMGSGHVCEGLEAFGIQNEKDIKIRIKKVGDLDKDGKWCLEDL